MNINKWHIRRAKSQTVVEGWTGKQITYCWPPGTTTFCNQVSAYSRLFPPIVVLIIVFLQITYCCFYFSSILQNFEFLPAKSQDWKSFDSLCDKLLQAIRLDRKYKAHQAQVEIDDHKPGRAAGRKVPVDCQPRLRIVPLLAVTSSTDHRHSCNEIAEVSKWHLQFSYWEDYFMPITCTRILNSKHLRISTSVHLAGSGRESCRHSRCTIWVVMSETSRKKRANLN